GTLGRVFRTPVQDDAPQFTAVENVTGPFRPLGDLLDVDAADPVEHVLQLQGQDRPQVILSAGVDLVQVQAAGGLRDVSAAAGVLKSHHRVAGAVQAQAATLRRPAPARQLVEQLREAGDGGGAEAP